MVLNDIINQAAARGSMDHPSRRESRKISLFLSSGDDDEEGPRLKERLAAACCQLVDIMCVWDCCGAYVKLAEFLSFIIFDPFIDLFITLCIVINTLFMALDRHNMDQTTHDTLKLGNYVSRHG